MAHKVAFSIPERQLGKRDIVFRVSKDDALFGTLRVSKGGVDWFPLKKQLGYGFDWSRIDRLFRTAGRRAAAQSALAAYCAALNVVQILAFISRSCSFCQANSGCARKCSAALK